MPPIMNTKALAPPGTSESVSRNSAFSCMIGQTYHSLTVIDLVRDADHRTLCVCRCECGTIIQVRPDRAKRYQRCSRHCPLIAKFTKNYYVSAKKMVGTHWGYLEVIDLMKRECKNGKWQTLCVCRCQCGVVKSYKPSDLRSGRTFSCGMRNCRKAHRGLERSQENHLQYHGEPRVPLRLIRTERTIDGRLQHYYETLCLVCGKLYEISAAALAEGTQCKECGGREAGMLSRKRHLLSYLKERETNEPVHEKPSNSSSDGSTSGAE